MELLRKNYFPQYKQEISLKKYKKEIGDQAYWVLSSSKQGNGIHQLRDNNMETFWQSDGPIPHNIDIQFQRKMRISEIALYLDIKTDESYTPETISVKGGAHIQNMREITQVQLDNPMNWIVIPLKTAIENGKYQKFVYTSNIQISILQMFHSGKDTHIRQVKIFEFSDDSSKEMIGKAQEMNAFR